MRKEENLFPRWAAVAAILILLIYLGLPLMIKNVYGVEEAFVKTPAGTIEVKTIPESTVLATEAAGNYYSRRNELFRRLFSYISSNSVAMTAPVEARIAQAQMKFYVGTKDKARALQGQGSVLVVSVPPRTVVSLGLRGAYTESNFAGAQAKLKAWLKDNKEYQQAGEAYAVFWDAPYMPWFLKRSEVHIPVNTIAQQ